jgi:hypothetical protein
MVTLKEKSRRLWYSEKCPLKIFRIKEERTEIFSPLH